MGTGTRKSKRTRLGRVSEIKLTIKDIPKSNNHYMGRGGKGLNFKYQEDKKKWAWLIRAAASKRMPTSPILKSEVTISYYFATRHRRDPDNYSGKFIMDGLVGAGIIKDDSFDCVNLILKGYYDKDNSRTEITIKEV